MFVSGQVLTPVTQVPQCCQRLVTRRQVPLTPHLLLLQSRLNLPDLNLLSEKRKALYLSQLVDFGDIVNKYNTLKTFVCKIRIFQRTLCLESKYFIIITVGGTL